MGGGLLPKNFEFSPNLKTQRVIPLFKKGMPEHQGPVVSKAFSLND